MGVRRWGAVVLLAMAWAAPDLPDPPVTKHVFAIPMADGQALTGNVYTMKAVVLDRVSLPLTYQAFPYDAYTEKALVLQWATAQLLYAQPPQLLLMQHMRGSGPESGEFVGFHVDRDIADTVAWLREQRWWNGVLYGTGTSAMGVMAYLSARVGAPLRAVAVSYAAADEFRMIYQNGAFRSALVNGMLNFINQPRYNLTYLQHEAPGPWWEATSLRGRYSDVKWPGVHMAAWYDVFQQDSLDLFQALREQAGAAVRDLQFLIVQPRGHCFSGGVVKWPTAALAQMEALFATFSGMLFGVLRDTRTPARFATALALLRMLARGIPRVFWFVLGPGLEGTKGNWIAAGNAFPASTATPLYLAPEGHLVAGAPGTAGALSYVFDPADPVPTLGGNNMGVPPVMGTVANLPCGPWDQLPVYHGRRDVLTFTSSPLPEDIAITGRVAAVLYVSSSAVDTDFTAKLVDVFPNGTRLLINDGIQRMRWRDPAVGPLPMAPGEVYRIEVDLWSTSYIFPQSHSIGLDVSSSNAPRFDVNPNTGALLRDTEAGVVRANNTVHFGPDRPSHLVLPIVPLSAVAPVSAAFLQHWASRKATDPSAPLPDIVSQGG